ncbi:Arylsulfatase [Aquisphaera giovannonii]|uniref:Arylsulfatase n=1 Tax=Aquisphaera giovannonii TaxID=406548 RepID=A0A5B9VWV4_9BACT|nr:sulfatase-like hydrolase/transferase [Aquisphaera giovannonii]QEH32748.1 Arylsulfatase [Aquisphaera giovannonii]
MDVVLDQDERARPRDRIASPLSVARLALLFGLVTGTLEAAQWIIRNAISGGVSLGASQMSRHFVWMIPASNVLIFGLSGVVLGLLAWLLPRWIGRIALGSMGFLCGLALLLTVPGLYAFACLAVATAAGVLLARHGALGSGRLGRVLVLVSAVSAAIAVGLHDWDRVLGALRDARPSPTAAHRGRPNVLLLVMDTVRAESLSLYGYDRDTTPNLNRLASRAVRFDQARSTAPWTLPSHASMFTGRWHHDLDVGERKPLGKTYPTLAEVLGSHGYATAGFIANTFFCNHWFGLARGFDHYDDYYEEQTAISLEETLRCSSLGKLAVQAMSGAFSGVERRRKDASRINAAFLSWLDRRDDTDRPFFAFLNYFDAHGPFIPPDGARRPFGRPPANAEEAAAIVEWDNRSHSSLKPDQIALARDSYDDCLAYLDEQIGLLFAELADRGELDDTLIILTADHGEAIGDHNLTGHGRSLYDSEVHVPLLIFLPDRARGGEVVAEPVSLRDIPATVLEVIGLRGTFFPGSSLAGQSPGAAPALTEVRIKEGTSHNPARPPAWRGPMSALVAGGHSYIRNADGREELYDVAADAAQLHDLAPSPDSRPILERMRERLSEMTASEDEDD